jgi:hypothetical protein
MTLLVDALELWAPTAGYAFEIAEGGPDDLPVYRGANVTIPQKPGQTVMPKVADSMVVILHGQVHGEAGGGLSASESYLDRITALNNILDPDAGTFTITVAGEQEGLSTGETATITVEFQRWTKSLQGSHFRYGEIECVCVSDPPVWVVSAGS